MKLLVPFLCLLIFSTSAICQTYNYKYFLNKDLASVDSASALFIGKGLKEESLFLLNGFEKNTGKLFMSAHFTDSSLSTLKGPYKSYYSSGKIEQEGNYENNIEEGLWIDRDSSGFIKDSVIYKNGIRQSFTRFSYFPDGKLMTRNVFDSAGKEKSFNAYDTEGNGIKEDKIFSNVEVEAQFPGGPYAFRKFLQQNLRSDIPGERGALSGTYTVVVKFIVDIDGSLSEITSKTNLGFGMEAEVMRVIALSPRWEPAMQNGRIVKAIRMQPVTFVIDNGDRDNRRN